MTHFVGLEVSQKTTAICVVDYAGHRLWRGQCPTEPEQIAATVRRHAGDDPRIGIEPGAMTPRLVHELRALGLEVICLDARHARAALKDANQQDGSERRGRIGSDRSHRLVPVGSREVVRQPPCSRFSRGENSTRRYEDPIVRPHSWGAQDFRSVARRDAGLTI